MIVSFCYFVISYSSNESVDQFIYSLNFTSANEWAICLFFRAGRSTTEHIFNLRILCDKYLQHQQNLYHVFVDFKKVFDRVWHAAWQPWGLYNINANLIRSIECLYDKETSAVYHDNNIGEWFRTTIGVRKGCLFSPTLSNFFLERIMADALEDHEGTVTIGGRTITNLRFVDGIDGLAKQEQELINLVNHTEEASTAYGMQIVQSRPSWWQITPKASALTLP